MIGLIGAASQSINSPGANGFRLEDTMNTMQRTTLGLAIAMGAAACSAQNTAIPFKQIERDARTTQLSATAAVPANEAAAAQPYEMVSSSSSSASFVSVPATKRPRTLSKGFYILNGLHLGMAVFDVGMTQHCIANHHCVEGNPLMPSSQAGQLGLNFAFVGGGAYSSYKLKEQDSRLWVLSPTVGIAAHAVGVASGFAHR
jgi:hypothetical protein